MNIKKKLKIIIPAVILALGIILIITGLAKGALNDYKKALDLSPFEAKLPVGNTYNLDIDISLANINVICSNDVSDFSIVADDVTKDFIEYTTTNNTLKLRYETQKWYQTIFLPGYRKNIGTINIYVPAALNLKDVEIKSGYGEMNISYLTAERIFIECNGEDNHIKNLTCQYAEISNNGGNLNGMNINAANADLNLISDTAVFSNFTTQSLVLNNDGDLKLSGMITGNSTFKSDGGDVNVTLYGNKSDYSFTAIEGDVSVNGKEAATDDNAQYVFEIIGDIEFNIK